MRPRPASLSMQARPPRPRQWSYHQTGIVPRLKFFVSHSYENCRGGVVLFPNRNTNFSANQSRPLTLFFSYSSALFRHNGSLVTPLQSVVCALFAIQWGVGGALASPTFKAGA